MKILKIQFKNINSLQGNHEIDFTKSPFNQSGLFAITGATGSGKTTILDAIVLALFNKIPRFGNANISKNSIENTGSILTRGQEEAEASVIYESAQGQFQSVWRISTNRNGNLRDYEMEIFELATGKSLVEKKSEVPSKNEELIGLKYDQFVKSVLLAQGSFAEFLKADKAHRSELLEKITGTDIYRRLGIRAFEKYRDFKNDIEILKSEKQNREQELISNEEVVELKKHQKEILKSIQEGENEEKELVKELEHQRQILSEEKELKNWEEKANEIHQKQEQFLADKGKILALHQQVEPYSGDLISWKRLQEEIAQKENRNSSFLEELSKIETQKLTYHNEICSLLKKEIPTEQYEAELRLFERKVVNLQREIQDIATQYTSKSDEITVEIRPLNITFERKKPKEFKSELETLLQLAKATLEELNPRLENENFSDAEQFLIELENRKYALTQAQNDSREIQNLENQLQKLTKEIQDLETKLLPFPEQIKEQKHILELTSEKLKTKVLQKEHQQLLASLDEHRKHLEDGKPCPLCGALEHPYSQNIERENIDLLSTEIQNLQEKQKTAQTSLTQLQSNQENISELKHQTEYKKMEIEKEKSQKRENFSQKYHFDFDTNWEQAIHSTEQLFSDVKSQQKAENQKDIIERILPKVDFLIQKQTEGRQKQAEKTELYNQSEPIENCISEYEKRWQKIKDNFNSVREKQSEVLENLKQLKNQLSETENQLSKSLQKSEIDDIPTAFKVLLPYEKAKELMQIRESLHTDFQNSQSQINMQKSRLETLFAKGEKKSSEALEEQQKNVQDKLISNRKEKENIQLKLSQQTQTEEKINELSKRIKEQEKESRHWRLLREIIGDAQGKKFSTFAQDLTLLQLLSLANKRLQLLSKRYIITNSQENEEDNLVIIDQDMGGQRRSVKTLSGGETFVVSLALALALSDLASQNVQIKSLFVDEGFGTLDPETLDQTLDTLERLQEEGSKMIGIISHVNSLKERIATQIQLKQNGRGYSSLKIVG